MWNSSLALLTRAAPRFRLIPPCPVPSAPIEARHFSRRSGSSLLFGDAAAFPNVDIGTMNARKPPSLAYFTGNSRYWDMKQTVDDYVEAAKRLLTFPGITRGKAPTIAWLKRETIKDHWKVEMTSKEYREVIQKVQSISRFSPLPYKFQSFVDKFVDHDRMKVSAFDGTPLLNRNGFAVTVGRRKNCKVNCKMVEGEGEILINGKSVVEYFAHPYNRETVLQPFIASETLGKFNTWIDLRNGGASGQSAAIAVAIARGLCLHRPELVPVFRELNLLKIDPRRHEGKKPGQPGAREKNAWVKR